MASQRGTHISVEFSAGDAALNVKVEEMPGLNATGVTVLGSCPGALTGWTGLDGTPLRLLTNSLGIWSIPPECDL